MQSDDTVSGWQDQSSKGNDAVQSTATKRPTLLATAVNGLPALRFDGAEDYLHVSDDVSLQFGTGQYTVEVVARSGDAPAQSVALLVAALELGLTLALIRRPPCEP